MEERRVGTSRAHGEPIETLLVRHIPAVRAFIRLRSGAAVRAMESSGDLAQSVCREALEEFHNLRFETEAAFRRWLFTVALHKVMDRGRQAAVRRRDAESPLVSDASDASSDGALGAYYSSRLTPSGAISDRESMDRLERAFDALPDEQREALVLARIVGLTHAEVGEQIGKSEEAVRKILSRALARLTTLLR